MTIGQRIAQRRKELNLSQEALGERLGVSRQAIYKWESDAALPEIDKLVTLSRLFSVTVGWLLGVEDAAEPAAEGELTETQLQMVEEIADRYLAAQPPVKQRKRWPRVLAAAVLAVVLCSLFNRLEQLGNQYDNLQNSVGRISDSVNGEIRSITQRVEEVLKSQNDLTAEYGVELLRGDLEKNSVVFSVYAVPKTYTKGMRVLFQASDGNGGNTSVEGAADSSGQKYTANVACTLTDNIDLSVIFVSADGTRQTQLLKNCSALYSGTFPSVATRDYGQLMNKKLADGAITLSDVYVTTRRGQAVSDNNALPRAKVQSIRMGLFKNKKLVSWAQACAQPERFRGLEDCDFYRLPDQRLVVKPGDVIRFAAVVTDEYGRSFLTPEVGYVLDEEMEFTWGEDQQWDTDLKNWVLE